MGRVNYIHVHTAVFALFLIYVTEHDDSITFTLRKSGVHSKVIEFVCGCGGGSMFLAS